MKTVMRLACSLAGALVLTASGAAPVFAQDHDAHNRSVQQIQTADQKKQANSLVRIVRESTVRFRDATAAENEGYGLLFGCVSGGECGAMGLHYVNFPLVADGQIDATKPEIVLYEPTPSGGLRITGVDYLVFAADWEPDPHECPRAQRAALSFLRRAQPLRTAAVLHAARVGMEGQPHRHVHELESQGVVRWIQRTTGLISGGPGLQSRPHRQCILWA